MSHTWDPTQYLRFEDARARPFLDLVARIPDTIDVRRVFDLGCGPGNMTVSLLDRFPNAKVTGIDRSKEMVETARPLAEEGRLDFQLGDVCDFQPNEAVQVIVSNATLQWVPGHIELFPHLVSLLDRGGSFAFQVPNQTEEPSHLLLRDLADQPRWRDHFEGLQRADATRKAATYLEVLMDLGCVVDAWESIYLQLLTGTDPVLEWTRGTALRPYLAALDESDVEEFTASYAASLRVAYPAGRAGTVFPFRRIFVVATRAT